MADNELTVDDLRKILAPSGMSTTPSASSTSPPAGLDVRSIFPEEKTYKTGLGEDITRSAGAGLARGAVGLVGLPGDIESLGRLGARYAGYNVGQETILPTSEEAIRAAEKYVPYAQDIMEYEPERKVGQYVKTIGTFAPSALGGPGTLGTRLAGTTGAAIATQGIEDVLKGKSLEGTPQEAALKIAASVPGYALGARGFSTATAPVKWLKDIALPEAEASRRIASTLGADIRRGTANIPADMDVPTSAMAGQQTRKLIQASSERAPDSTVGAYRTSAAESQMAAPKNMMDHIDNIFAGGATVDPFDAISINRQNAKITNSKNYQNAFASPAAQNVAHPDLDMVVNSLPQGTVNRIADLIRMDPKMGNPAQYGMVKSGSNWQINPQGMPLEFWNYVKQDLDNSIRMLKDPTTGVVSDANMYRILNGQNQILKNTLDKIVPEYAVARGAAAEAAGFDSAMDLGMGFLNVRNDKKLNYMMDTLNKLTPEQRENAAYGLAGAYRRMFEKNPDAAFNLFTGKTGGEMQNRFRAVMGNSAADDLIGKSMQQGMLRNIQSLGDSSGSMISKYAPFGGAAVGGILPFAENFLQNAIWSGNPTAALYALTGYAGGKLYSLSEARVAGRILELVQDPRRSAELAKLAASDPNARSFLNKTMDLLARRTAGAESTMGQSEDRPQRASGGRIGSDALADKLVRAAEVAKKSINSRTEHLLNQPDETIAKALDVAKRHI